MSSIMDLIGLELCELSALELEKLPYLILIYTLASAKKDQLAQNLVKIYMTIRCRMRLIMVPVGLEQPVICP